MHGLLAALKRGFKRWIGWRRLGVAGSVFIIAFAITKLVRTLKGIDTGVILTALTALRRGIRGWAPVSSCSRLPTSPSAILFPLRTEQNTPRLKESTSRCSPYH